MMGEMQRVALITGGSRGLGSAIAMKLANDGMDIAFTFLEDRTAADKVVQAIEKAGRRALAVQADVRDFARAQEVTKEVLQKLGGLHALVCNAGVGRDALLHEISEESWDEVVDICLKGSFNYMRAASSVFRAQKEGKIVCIGSINAKRGRPLTASYNAAKAGLSGLVKTAAVELGAFNINVNLVAPGFIESSGQKKTPQPVRDQILNECAIKRLGTPEDIAPVVSFLCSDASRHITGQVLTVDAGQSLSSPLDL